MKDPHARRRAVTILFLMSLFVPLKTAAQAAKGAGNPAQSPNQPASPSSNSTQAGSTGGGGTGGTTLPGMSYTRSSWGLINRLPPPATFDMAEDDFESFWDHFSKDSFRKNIIINCYVLKQNLSASQPFLMEPQQTPTASPGIKQLCANSSHKIKSRSLVMSRFLVFRIDLREIKKETRDRIQTMNINVTAQTGNSLNAQRGSPMNPTPTRPSMALLSPPSYNCKTRDNPQIVKRVLAKYELGDLPLNEALCPEDPKTADIYYLTWPGELIGDTTPTVSINLIYTPVAPGLEWESETFYPAGSVVISSTNNTTNGHYYVAVNGGRSGSGQPPFSANANPVPIFKDSGGVYWKDMGQKPAGDTYPYWKKENHYFRDDHVVPQVPNGHYYHAEVSGMSGTREPAFPRDGGTVYDTEGLTWEYVGRTQQQSTNPPTQTPQATSTSNPPSSAASNSAFKPWVPGVSFVAGQQIVPPGIANGHYYEAVNSGISGQRPPVFPDNGGTVCDGTLANGNCRPQGVGGVEWRDMGLLPKTSTAPPWTPSTLFVIRQQVVPPGAGNGHYYEAENPGISGIKPPRFPVKGETVCDGTLENRRCSAGISGVEWQDMGFVTIPAWQAGTGYAMGALVVPSPANGFYYQASVAGVSGAGQPAFPQEAGQVTESVGLTWVDLGSSPTLPGAIKTLKDWTSRTAYVLGDGILHAPSGHYYLVIQPGISGEEEPPFSIPAPSMALDAQTGQRWQDLGMALPSSVLLGTQPPDLTVNLLGLTYPQVQVLTRFNLSSGVVISSLRPNTISSFPATGVTMTNKTGTGCPTGVATCTIYTSSAGSHLIDPVLGVTVYALKPLDAERPFKISDLVPAPTLDISLSSPTTNFHFGFSSELFMRNLQIVYGASIVEETVLSGTKTKVSGQPTALYTGKSPRYGSFVGITFNITGFIQSMIP